MIALTGSTGFIGSNIKHDIKINRENIDKIDLKDVSRVYHLGAYSHTNMYGFCYNDNVAYTNKLVEKSQHTRFIFTSSVQVYDNNGKVNPDSWYALSKWQCEQIINMAAKDDWFTPEILRLANTVSIDLRYGFLWRMVEQIRNGRVRYFPGAYRPFIHLDDCVKAITMPKDPGTYDVCNNAISVESVIKIAQKYAEFETSKMAAEPRKIEPNTNRLTRYGWNPKPSEEVVEEYFKYHLG